jgi:hypothetical protein
MRRKRSPYHFIFRCQIGPFSLLLLGSGRRILGNGLCWCRRWLVECSGEQMVREDAGVVWFFILSRGALLFIKDKFCSLFRRLLLQLTVPFSVMFLPLQICLGELFRDIFLPSDGLLFRSREGHLLRDIRVFRGHLVLLHVTDADVFGCRRVF